MQQDVMVNGLGILNQTRRHSISFYGCGFIKERKKKKGQAEEINLHLNLGRATRQLNASDQIAAFGH